MYEIHLLTMDIFSEFISDLREKHFREFEELNHRFSEAISMYPGKDDIFERLWRYFGEELERYKDTDLDFPVALMKAGKDAIRRLYEEMKIE